MDLGAFLADNSLGGSWADEEIDMASIGVPMSTAAPISNRRTAESSYGSRDGGFGSRDGGFGSMAREQRDREEYPIPDEAPYRARVGNLAWEITEDALVEFFETKLKGTNIISDVNLPVDNLTGKLRGFGFLTFVSRDKLEAALNLSFSDFNGRKIFIDVAAPERQDVFDMDWRSGRGPLKGNDRGDRGDRPPRREEADIDWTSARGSGTLPPRESRGGDRGDWVDRGDRGDRPPRREDPDIDWSSARGSGVLPPREPRGERAEWVDRGDRSDRPPRREREEPNLDWTSARGSGVLPPREPRADREAREPRPPRKDEPLLDWGSARGSGMLPPRERPVRQKQPETDNLDWKRGQPLLARAKPPAKKTDAQKEDKESKPHKSSFDVLAVEDDDEEGGVDETKETGLEESTAELSIGLK